MIEKVNKILSETTRKVFSDFLSVDFVEESMLPFDSHSEIEGHIVSIGVTGGLNGFLSFCYPFSFADYIVDKFKNDHQGLTEYEILRDHLGEVTNIAIGNTLTVLNNEYGMTTITTPLFASGTRMIFSALKQETMNLKLRKGSYVVNILIALKKKGEL